MKNWLKTIWLISEFDALEAWIRSKNYTAKERAHFTKDRDSIENLALGGMHPNELRLQVDEKHNLLYCNIPKTGSSTWIRTMMKLSNDKG